MAGSYKHIVNSKNDFIGVDLIDHLGDAYEALEECWYMINFLAGGDLGKISDAHRKYISTFNPERAEELKNEDYFEDDEDEDEVPEIKVEFNSVDWKNLK